MMCGFPGRRGSNGLSRLHVYVPFADVRPTTRPGKPLSFGLKDFQKQAVTLENLIRIPETKADVRPLHDTIAQSTNMMKRLIFLSTALLVLSSGAVLAQSSVHEKDLRGVWHLTFNIADRAENPGEQIVLGAVEGLLDWIDIRFEFLPENRLKVMVDVFGEEEVEYAEWRVNDRHELVLSNSDHFDAEGTVWLFEGGRLVAYEYQGEERVRSSDGVILEMAS